MSHAKATETDPTKMSDHQLASFLKYQYQRTAHDYERLDYAIRLTMRGETPEHSLKWYRMVWIKQMDRLQAAIDEQERRAINMR